MGEEAEDLSMDYDTEFIHEDDHIIDDANDDYDLIDD